MSERDKWGRIPAKLIEIDQDFCALTWSERRCRAGNSQNLHAHSASLGESPWTLSGSAAVSGSPLPSSAGQDESIGPNNVVTFSALNDIVEIPSANYNELPVVDITDPSVVSGGGFIDFKFIIENTGNGSDEVTFTLTLQFFLSGSLTTRIARFRALGSGLAFDDSPPPISLTLGTSLTPDGNYYIVRARASSSAFSDNPTILAYSAECTGLGSASIDISCPQVNFSDFPDYAQTSDTLFYPETQPCFNTLSSCQTPETYTIKGLKDALSLGNTSADTNVYTGPFTGNRLEGVYLEFYVNQQTAPSSDHAAQPIIDIDGLLTASVIYDAGTSSNSRIEFSVDGGSQEYELLGSIGDSYRVAAFVSKSGDLIVRGVDGVVSANPISDVTPSEVTISGVDSATTGEFYISDVLIYDYEVRPLNVDARLKDLVQKGDLTGDAIFYAPFIDSDFSERLSTLGGLAPSPADLDTIDREGFDSGGDFILYSFGVQELLEPPLILRFTERQKSSRLPETLRAIPSLNSAQNKAGQLQVGGTNENISALGSRDELMVNFEDHPYSDYLVDPYRDQRTYDPASQGTFWGKWLARNVYRKGFGVRYVTGYELPTGGFERVHSYSYFLDKVNGPTAKGKVSLKAFDILQSLRADKAVYPAASTGFLRSSLSESATAGSTFDLDPVGIGDDEYPSGSFRVRIGGEGFDVTRSGDTLTIDARGLYGGAESHSAEDSVQVVGQIDAEQIHDAAYIIITTALPELEGYIPKSKWDGLADDFLPRLYTADITEPTGVEDLLGELVSIAPIYFYTDIRTNLIELGVIREPSSAAIELTEDQELIADTVDLKEYPKERIDEVWVYYRIRDAAGDIDDQENYSQRFILVNPEEQARRGERSIKRIYSRWLEGGGSRDTAEEVAQAYISRFQNTPIRVSFDLDAREGDIWLGDVAKLITRQKQTVTGENESDLNYQIIQAHEPEAGHAFQYIAQSYEFFSPVDPDAITITILPEDTIDSLGAVDQINLRELYDATVATQIDDITFVVAGGPQPSGGTVVGATSGQTWSLRNPNDWPWAPTIELRVEEGGNVVGKGGDGGRGEDLSGGPESGGTGQTALLVEYALSINNLGVIGGGGGGGGGGAAQSTVFDFVSGGGGGGGAGRISLAGAGGDRAPNLRSSVVIEDGEPGTPLNGGSGGASPDAGRGGRGGDLGQAGSSGQTSPSGDPGGSGGSAGLAIDGISNVTFITRGDIRGNTT